MASIELILLVTVLSAGIAFLVGRYHKVYGAIVTILATTFVFVSLGYHGYNDSLDNFVAYLPYVSFSITYLGLYFAIIVSFIFAMVAFFNPFFVEKYKYPAAYSALYLLSLAGVIGVFFTNNFMTLFFFFEFVVWTSLFLIPMGGSKKAAKSYYAFSTVGSFALLYAIFIMRTAAGTFNINQGLSAVSGGEQALVIVLLLVAAFAKLGAFPLNVWLPRVLGKSPDPVSAVFSGGLEKLGAFVAVLALVKLAPVGGMFEPTGLFLSQYVVLLLGSLTIVFGTLMAIRSDDAKKLLAYSSMSNGGYILVALSLGTTAAVSGGLYHILAHALASSAAFLAIGAVSRVTGTTKMSELGGMIHKMPVSYMVYLIAIISMAGIPPMGGFISKWLIFQAVINNGLIFVAIAVFFGSIGSFLYVFRPLAALFLGQELPQHRDHSKEAPFFMLVPMVILSLLNVVTGVIPNVFLKFINNILLELNIDPLTIDGMTLTGKGFNGTLHPVLISGMFAIGVGVAFIIFIVLKKSKKVGLMDTYTAGNFIYSEELLHYSVDFYAPLERLYEKHTNKMKNFYKSLENKVVELGQVVRYYFFTNKPEVTVFWIVIIIAFLLWGEVL
jgi:formate hydrogenlyase subunit 3/multisubunit Na+/H+ antiporter MnhD subunit